MRPCWRNPKSIDFGHGIHPKRANFRCLSLGFVQIASRRGIFFSIFFVLNLCIWGEKARWPARRSCQNTSGFPFGFVPPKKAQFERPPAPSPKRFSGNSLLKQPQQSMVYGPFGRDAGDRLFCFFSYGVLEPHRAFCSARAPKPHGVWLALSLASLGGPFPLKWFPPKRLASCRLPSYPHPQMVLSQNDKKKVSPEIKKGPPPPPHKR